MKINRRTTTEATDFNIVQIYTNIGFDGNDLSSGIRTFTHSDVFQNLKRTSLRDVDTSFLDILREKSRGAI